MKKLMTLLTVLTICAVTLAQSPQKMSYQTVIRNATDDLVTNSPVGIRVSILQDSATGVAVFTETHLIMTNTNGLASLEVGVGNPPSVAFGHIDWSSGPYFIRSEIDPTGGTNYSLSGTTELLSVPYALFARKVDNAGFTTSANVTSNTEGDQATDDFVFGSPQLDDDGNSDHDARMFYDKSKGAFRVGESFGTEWDDMNVGLGSVAMGLNTIASGARTTAMGEGTTANGNYSTAMGLNTTASGHYSTATGFSTNASASWSTAMGYFTTASGNFSTAIGGGATASGQNSTSIGNLTTAPSYAETVVGAYNTTYTPQSTVLWNALDRIFVIGNGSTEGSRSDAMVVTKNGNVGLGTSTPNETLEIGGAGRAFFGDGNGENRKGILIDGIQGTGAGRIEAFSYESLTGRDLVFNTTPNAGLVGIYTNEPTARLSVNGSANKPGGGSWAVFSDKRLKKEICSYEDGLSAVLAINPVNFKYNSLSKADTISEFVGVIAQELEKISPYMINTIELDGIEYLEVDNSAMTYMLINAIQELNAIIENQNAKIDDLSIENSELKADNENKDVRLDDLDVKLRANTKLLQELNGILKAQSKR